MTMTTTLEIKLVSAEGLDKCSSSCFNRLSPFITLTKLPTRVVCQYNHDDGEEHVFRVPVDPAFFSDATRSCLHLQLYNKRRFVGPTKLGWCLISATDIGPLFPSHFDSVRFLSFRLRAVDGSVGPAIVNLSIRLICCHTTVVGIPCSTVLQSLGPHGTERNASLLSLHAKSSHKLSYKFSFHLQRIYRRI